jgi:hypothetical protein
LSVAITLDTYAHVLPSMRQSVAERLEEVMYKQRRPEPDAPKGKDPSGTL